MKENNKKHQYGIILAGGSGMRLWPISRELYPKQLLKLTGDKTLIQETFLRLKKILPAENIYIATNENLFDNIYFQLKKLGVIKESIIKEPASKNTAPAIALAAKIIFDRDNQAVLLVSSADHRINGDSEFIEAAKTAFKAARDNFLITFGIIPDNPSQEYGYIVINSKFEARSSKPPVFKMEKFVEKPDLKKAKELIKKGAYWNSGIFAWKAETILKEIKKFLPDIYKAVILYDEDFNKFLKFYRSLKSVSIDNGVLEKAKNVLVIPAKFKWQDIGSWKSLHRLLPKNREANVLGESVISEDCFDCLIQGTKKRITVALGLKDLIVVDSEDAVLVAHKDYSHKIKNSLEKMRKDRLNQYREHPTVYRPWGLYTVLEGGENFKVKKVLIEPKQKLSLQLHKKRAEHWVVLRGKALVQIDDKIFNLKSHQSIDIPKSSKHRLENPGNQPLEIIETQSGNYLKEDDVVRFEDKYGREK